MAFKRFKIDGYGQLELNQVAFRRDGRVEAQCALDDTDFASVPAENGMLLAVDRVNRKIKFPKSAVIATCPVALNYTTEHMYDESATAPEDGPVLKVVEATTMPDGSFGIKFQVLKA